MGFAIVRYSVKEGSLRENRTLIAKVFEDLRRSAPPSLRYLVIEVENGEFLHIVGEEAGTATLPQLDAFKAFTVDHAERRSTPISRSSVAILGNYNMLAETQSTQRHRQ